MPMQVFFFYFLKHNKTKNLESPAKNTLILDSSNMWSWKNKHLTSIYWFNLHKASLKLFETDFYGQEKNHKKFKLYKENKSP